MIKQSTNPFSPDTLSYYLLEKALLSKKGIIFIRENDEQFLSYKDLYLESIGLLNNLDLHGIYPGHELIFQLEDQKSFLITFWACILGGIIPVPISIGNQYQQIEKLSKIQQRLDHPKLVYDRNNLNRIYNNLKKIIAPEKFDHLLQNAIAYESLTDTSCEKTPVILKPEDIGYIQFSSGSTGDPKGVILSHQNLVTNAIDIKNRYSINENHSSLSWMPLTHDMGLICFHITSLISNVNQYIIPTVQFIMRPLIWLKAASKYKVSQLYSPNFGYAYLMNALKGQNLEDIDLSTVKVIYNGAENISFEICKQFETEMSQFGLRSNTIYPGYGLAEASVAVSLHTSNTAIKVHYLDRDFLNIADTIKFVDKTHFNAVPYVEVGKGIDNCKIRICDSNNSELPKNTLGHVQIKGSNVTSGYYNDPIATKNVFAEDGWLKTGDIGFLINDQLTITGRLKNIIIVNGQNYFPTDIEDIVIKELGIALGKVVVTGYKVNHKTNDSIIVFILHKGSVKSFIPTVIKTKKVIHSNIGIRPHAVIPIRKIPKTTSGKIRNYLLVNDYAKNKFRHIISQIDTFITQEKKNNNESVEFFLHKLVKEVFQEDDIQNYDNFQDKGLTSLQALIMANKIKSFTSMEINVQDLFENPSIKLLTEFLSDQDKKVISAPNGSEDIPGFLTPLQKGIYRMCQLPNASNAYDLHSATLIKGSLSQLSLEKAITAVVKKHSALRAHVSIPKNHEDPMLIFDDYSSQKHDVKLVDISNSHDKTGNLIGIETDFCNSGLDLLNGPLFQIMLIRISLNQHILLFKVHHLVFDGWSFGILKQELSYFYKLYEAKKETDIDSSVYDFKDFLKDHHQQVYGSAHLPKQKFWLNELKEKMPKLALPYQKSPATKSYKGRGYYKELNKKNSQIISNFCAQNKATLYCSVISVVFILLHKYTNQKNIAIGSVASGRNEEKLLGLIGNFTNTLFLKTLVNVDQSFEHFVQKVRKLILDALQNSEYPIEKIVEDHPSLNQDTQNFLFDVLVVFQNFDHDFSLLTDINNIKTENYSLDITNIIVDLEFEFFPRKETMGLLIKYNHKLFSAALIEKMWLHFDHLMTIVLTNPSERIKDFSLLLPDEIQLLQKINQTEYYSKDEFKNVIQKFETKAADIPNNLAITSKTTHLTYKKLQEQIDIYAAYLRSSHRIGKGSKVVFLLPSSEKYVVFIMAIWKLRAIYIPIDVDNPAERINQILNNIKPQWLLVDSTSIESIKKIPSNFINIDQIIPPGSTSKESWEDYDENDLAYIMHTSGSTGDPKGVMIPHKALINYLDEFQHFFRLCEKKIVLQQASMAFDTSLEEIFPILISGGRLIINEQGGKNIETLVKSIRDENVTLISATPHIINEINQRIIDLPSLNQVISGGDKLSFEDIDQILPIESIRVYNTYGPTETTICATFKIVKSSDDVKSIGNPIRNVQVFVLNNLLQQLPPGIQGEICISGIGLGIGYFEKLEETDANFIPHPFVKGAKLYRTGDMGKIDDEGNLIFLGRQDSQVSIHGYRIELMEIVKAIKMFPQVNQVEIILHNSETNKSGRLVAFISSRVTIDTNQLLVFLGKKLPHYMIPNAIFQIDDMPRTINLKVDKDKLEAFIIKSNRPHEKPKSQLQKQVSEIWENLFKSTDISIKENFFSLGGNSILAIKMLTHINNIFQIKFTVTDLYTHPTIYQLAQLIENKQQVKDNTFPISPLKEQHYYDVSPYQKMIWLEDQKESETLSHYNLFWIYEMKGELKLDLLNNAIKVIVNQHESLRTSFHLVNGKIKQKIHPIHSINYQKIQFEYLVNDNVDVQEIALNEQSRGFKMDELPLFKIRLLQLSKDNYLFMFNVHHIIADGMSINIILKSILNLYELQLTNNTNLNLDSDQKINYKEYAHFINRKLERGDMQKSEDFWFRKLENYSPLQRRALGNAYFYDRHSNVGTFVKHKIPTDLISSLKQIATKNQVSLFTILTTALKVLLYKHTGQNLVTVGTVFVNRNYKEVEDLIGFFVNTVVLCSLVDYRQSLRGLIKMVNNTILEAFDHQEYPFFNLMEAYNKDEKILEDLFDIMIVFHNYVEQDENQLPALQGTSVKRIMPRSVFSKFKIKFDLFYEQGGIDLFVEYNSSLFLESYVNLLINQYISILTTMVKNDTELVVDIELNPSITVDVNQKIKKELKKLEPPTIADLFLQVSKNNPKKKSIVHYDRFITYEDLYSNVELLASKLYDLSVKKNEVTLVLLENSVEYIQSILAIANVGGKFLSIDPSLPFKYIISALEKLNVNIVITSSAVWDQKSGDLEKLSTKVILADDLGEYQVQNHAKSFKNYEVACLHYTLGEHGIENVIEVSERTILNYVKWCIKEYGKDKPIIIPFVSSTSSDIALCSILMSILSGGTLKLFNIKHGQFNYSKILLDREINTVKLTPTQFRNLCSDLVFSFGKQSFVKNIIVSGEKLPHQQATKAISDFDDEIEIFYEYSPWGVPVSFSSCRFGTNTCTTRTVPIGQNILESEVRHLDKFQNCVQPGSVGEIYLAGGNLPKLRRINQDISEADRYNNPNSEKGLMLKTGDFAYSSQEGAICILGNKSLNSNNEQLLRYCEAVQDFLIGLDFVQDAEVLIKNDSDDFALTACIIPENDYETLGVKLEYALREHFPDIMIPEAFIFLGSFPLDFVDRMDYQKLQSHQVEYEIGSKPLNSMVGENDVQLSEIFKEIFQTKKLSLQENFFHLGGNSISAIQLTSRIYEKYKVQISIQDIFKNPEFNLISDLIHSKKNEKQSNVELIPLEKQEFYDITASQLDIWLASLNKSKSVAFNMPGVFLIDGYLNLDKLIESFEILVERHENLRTTFHFKNGEVYQKIHPYEKHEFEKKYFKYEIHQAKLEDLEENLVTNYISSQFDLSEGPLLKVGVISFPSHHLLVFNMHHIISDAWSLEILLKELAYVYDCLHKNSEPAMPKLKIQFKDYADWAGRCYETDKNEIQEFWKNMLTGSIEPLNLKTDFNPSQYHNPTQGTVFRGRLNQSDCENLKSICASFNVSVYTVLLTITQLMLSIRTGQKTVLIGTTVSHRIRPELEHLIGYLSNLLPIICKIDPNENFISLIRKQSDLVMDVIKFQNYSISKMISDMELNKKLKGEALINVFMDYITKDKKNASNLFASLHLKEETHQYVSRKYDIGFRFIEQKETIEFMVEYDPSMFLSATIEGIFNQWIKIMKKITSKPDSPLKDLLFGSKIEKENIAELISKSDFPSSFDKTIRK